MKEYKKPIIEFCELQADKAVANTCWGYHDGTGVYGEDYANKFPDKMYCDVPGEGYVGFNITSGNCNFSDRTLSWTYYDGNKQPQKAPEGVYGKFKNVIEKAGGNKGQPFAGEGIVVKPTPDPTWS